MLKKLFKYDFKSVLKIWWIIAVVTLSVALIGAFSLRILNENNGVSLFIDIFGGLLFGVSVITVSASGVATCYLAAFRFYKNFYTDEGYLTFTLPVKRSTLLASKTLNTFLWTFLGLIVTLISVSFYVIISPVPTEPGSFFNPVAFKFIEAALSDLYKIIGGWLVLYIIEGVILALIIAFFSVTLVHFCITIGAIIAKKYKLIAGIAIFYLVSNAISLVAQFLNFVGVLSVAEGFAYLIGDDKTAACSVIALLLLILCAAFGVISFIFYNLTESKLERKLNLQ